MKITLKLLLVIFLFVSCNNIGSYNNPVYGTLHTKRLNNPEKIYGYPCKNGEVTFYDNDSLMYFVLYEDYKINNEIIPAESRITMYWNGKPEFIYLSKNTEIQGYNPRRKSSSHWHVSFYNDGSLQQFSLQNDIEIDGIPCRKNEDLILFPDGRLWVFTLFKEFKRDNRLYEKGSHLIFDENGKVHEYSHKLYKEIGNRLNMHKYTKRFYSKE